MWTTEKPEEEIETAHASEPSLALKQLAAADGAGGELSIQQARHCTGYGC
jgi:hypothetical protein